MPEYIGMTWGTLTPPSTGEYCVICCYALSVRFPPDFPDEWKVCCFCKGFMEQISNGNRSLIEYYYSGKGVDKRVKDLLDKIEKHITLVGK